MPRPNIKFYSLVYWLCFSLYCVCAWVLLCSFLITIEPKRNTLIYTAGMFPLYIRKQEELKLLFINIYGVSLPIYKFIFYGYNLWFMYKAHMTVFTFIKHFQYKYSSYIQAQHKENSNIVPVYIGLYLYSRGKTTRWQFRRR